MILLTIVIATFISGVGSVWLAAALMRVVMARYTQHMLSLAAGALLATALLHLLPEAVQSDKGAQELFTLLLGGLVFFFLLDKAELWHHGHEHGSAAHTQANEHAHGHEQGHEPGHEPGHAPGHAPDHDHGHTHAGKSGGWAVLLGDSVHCFGDGVLIAAAFVADTQLGVAATLAVLAHEVPHHIGDLAVLLQSSKSPVAAALKVSVAGSVTVLGGLMGYGFASSLQNYLPYLLVVGASSFVYVALADLIPQLQRRLGARETTAQIAWLGAGIALVALATNLAHSH